MKISAKLIRNFKQAYDEIDAKIFGNPFSLLSLKTPDFVEAFNRSFSTFLVGNFPGWFQSELVSTGVIRLPILGESNHTRVVYGNFEGVPSNNALDVCPVKWKMTSLEKALIFQVAIFH